MIPFTWNLVLALIWAALSGSFTGVNLLVGLVLGYLVLSTALRKEPAFADYRARVPRAFAFSGYFLKEFVKSNLRVAYDVLTPTHLMRPAVIAVPLEAETPGEITLVANVISLTPGTLSLDVASDRSVLYVHVMYLDNEKEVVAGMKEMERRILRLVR